jgi:hypothetical protein
MLCKRLPVGWSECDHGITELVQDERVHARKTEGQCKSQSSMERCCISASTTCTVLNVLGITDGRMPSACS